MARGRVGAIASIRREAAESDLAHQPPALPAWRARELWACSQTPRWADVGLRLEHGVKKGAQS